MSKMTTQSINLPQDVYTALHQIAEGSAAETLRKILTAYAEGHMSVHQEVEKPKMTSFRIDPEILEKAKCRAKDDGMTFTKAVVALINNATHH